MPLFLDILRSETAASPERRQAALTGLAAYQAAARAPRPEGAPVVARAGAAALRDYGGAGVPVMFVPSLINPPFILDLAPERSLLRWLRARGVRVLLVDWGTPAPGADDIDHHVAAQLVPLIAALDRPPVLVGYCLGGTMAAAAACLAPVAGLATLATPWHFSRFGDVARGRIAALWAAAQAPCRQLGLVPMEVLQTGFWQLDPARTIAKYEQFGTLPPNSAAARDFVALEDWANAGAPLSFGAGRQLFEDFYAADRPGRGAWTIGGRAIAPQALTCPTLDIVSTTDRIVPAASAAGLGAQLAVEAGHVGMVVGRRARETLWQPLADWLNQIIRAR
ncbi:alpha/beta fold hydrolase [Sphingomonas sp.]|uniref:alpha/beta fold hydrolase n=1 Tax=Sphingomonas sp. TaxID=28214 RepID=UPI001E12FDE3|nr:alpha/beta fold hydrolase [Sphingomonas sp.]MBX9795976.1 alpha/beta fold hydrolase [Sphingomonas sp.]